MATGPSRTRCTTTRPTRRFRSVAGDLDGANGLDLVTAHEEADLVGVLLNNGDGTFTAAADVSVEVIAATRSDPRAVVVGQFDADTNLDVAVALFARDMVALLPGNGDGTFWRHHDRRDRDRSVRARDRRCEC